MESLKKYYFLQVLSYVVLQWSCAIVLAQLTGYFVEIFEREDTPGAVRLGPLGGSSVIRRNVLEIPATLSVLSLASINAIQHFWAQMRFSSNNCLKFTKDSSNNLLHAFQTLICIEMYPHPAFRGAQISISSENYKYMTTNSSY